VTYSTRPWRPRNERQRSGSCERRGVRWHKAPLRSRGGRYYIRTRVRVMTRTPASRSGSRSSGKFQTRPMPRAGRKPGGKREAEEALKSLQGAVDDGQFKPNAGDRARAWPAMAARACAAQPQALHGRQLQGHVLHAVSPALGAYRVDEVTPAMIRTLLDRKRESGLRPETVSKSTGTYTPCSSSPNYP